MNGWRRDAALGRLRPGVKVRFSRTFTPELVRAFGELSRDYNPVHTDPAFARALGFRDVVCHGFLVASMITELGGQWAWLATGCSVEFRKPVYVGETVTCELTITSVDARRRAVAHAVLTNARGDVVQRATLTGVLPRDSAQARLAAMLDEGDPTNPLARPAPTERRPAPRGRRGPSRKVSALTKRRRSIRS